MNTLQKMISNTSTQNTSSVEKTCPLCNKKFIPKGRQKYCDGPHFKPCPVCGKPVPAPYPSDPPKCCSSECRKKLKETNAATPVAQVIEAPKVTTPVPVKAAPSPAVDVVEKEYPIDPELELSKDPLKILEKGSKEFFTKRCIVDTKIKDLIQGHVYNIEVIKESYTYQVILTYDHNYRKDLETVFNIASAKSFNNYFK